MKYHPILFNDAMVRAILSGAKTQTRRPIKPQPEIRPEWGNPRINIDGELVQDHLDNLQVMRVYGEGTGRGIKSQFGIPGDRLYIRECWEYYDTDKLESVEIVYRPSYDPSVDGTARDQGATARFTVPHHVAMSASHAIGLSETYGDRWRPSIHMPRMFSRTTLDVLDVRVEQIQDISNNDILAEGITLPAECLHEWECSSPTHFGLGSFNDPESSACGSKPWAECMCASREYERLWNSIYARQNLAWEENPWVGMCEFKMIEKGE